MRGHHNPLGWVATSLIAVAYAHVLLELAAVLLAVAVGVGLLVLSPVRDALRGRYHGRRLDRPPFAVVIERRPAKQQDHNGRGGH